MTATELIQPVGLDVLVRMAEFSVPCQITDTKETWGKTRFLVSPLNGEGQAWVEIGRIVKVMGATEKPSSRLTVVNR